MAVTRFKSGVSPVPRQPPHSKTLARYPPAAENAQSLLNVNYLSLFDKKKLTNEIALVILRAMNANKNSSKANARLKRIKYMSRFLKGLILACFVSTGLLVAYGRMMSLYGMSVLPPLVKTIGENVYQILYYALSLFAAITLYRLLNFYEKGMIFSAANASQIRRLGFLAIAYALLKACNSLFLPNEGIFMVPTTLINFLMSPWFFAGCFIIIITWIMDEGRKIQEEQALTV